MLFKAVDEPPLLKTLTTDDWDYLADGLTEKLLVWVMLG
jgi:hypothetical protein